MIQTLYKKIHDSVLISFFQLSVISLSMISFSVREERENNIPIEKQRFFLLYCVGILFSHNSLSSVCSVCSVCSRLV